MTFKVPDPKFSVGTRVRVRRGERNRTTREGTVRNVIWHFKDQRHNYYLQEDGKKVSKRYYDEDLEEVGG